MLKGHWVNRYEDGTYQNSARNPWRRTGADLSSARVFNGRGAARNSLRDSEKKTVTTVEVHLLTAEEAAPLTYADLT